MFHQAVCDGDVTKVKFLLKYAQGIQIDRPNKNGLTALQQSCFDGNLELVNVLLEQGADLSLVDSEGKTALHFAALGGDLETVSLLVNSSCADVNAKSVTGEKPLDVASMSDIRALLSQAMVAEEIKRKSLFRGSSTVEDWDINCYNYKQNYPGSRYSISSTSTDSGVSEDMALSGSESSCDQRFSSYQKPLKTSLDNYYNTNGEFVNTKGSTPWRERFEDRYVRKPGFSSPARSNSFTSSTTREENGEPKPSQPAGGEHSLRIAAQKAEALKFKRTHRAQTWDISRRRTVTFGEIEFEGAPRGVATQVNTASKSSSLRRPPISSSKRPPRPSSVNKTPSSIPQGVNDSRVNLNSNNIHRRLNSSELKCVASNGNPDKAFSPQTDNKIRNYAVARYI